jgi:hypothetical protein
LIGAGVKEDEDGWYDLPGDSEMWPDDPAYYIKWGFEPRFDLRESYLKAINSLKEDEPPQGWTEALLHEEYPDDFIFQRFFLA